MTSRTDSSSSTIEMIGISDKFPTFVRLLPSRESFCEPPQQGVFCYARLEKRTKA